MVSIWDSLKNALGGAGSAWQETQKNMYNVKGNDKPATTRPVNKPITNPVVLDHNALAMQQLGMAGATPLTNKVAQAQKNSSTKEIPETPTTNGGGGSGGGGSSSGGGYSASAASDAIYNAYAQAQARQEALYRQQDDLHRQKEELAAKQRDDLKATLLAQNEAAKKQRETVLNATLDTNNQAADKSLREAYIAYMLGKRNMPQELKAMGISGGATETTLADANNTYMNNRFGIEDGRNNANAIARRDYDTGINSDYVNYMAALSDVENAYANRMFDLLADKNNFLMERASNAASAGRNLADALASIPKTTSTPKVTTAATSTPASAAAGYKVPSQEEKVVNYYAPMQVQMGNKAYSVPQFINTMAAAGMSDDQIEAILRSQGIK